MNRKNDCNVPDKETRGVAGVAVRELDLIEGLLLKPNMVTPGQSHANKATPGDIAMYTVRTLSRTMVPALPGVTFLSGGSSE